MKNFHEHRRMRKRDKLAMQEDFIEREYRRLRQAAASRTEAYSQQLSYPGTMGVNPSEKVHQATNRGKP